MSMWFSCTETYRWSVCISSSFVIYWCWHIFVSKMFQNFNIVFDYLLMLTIFHVQNVVMIFDWCLCDFLVLKHIHEVHALHLHLSFTDVEIFLCCKCSRISILFLTIYWCWLFFMCKLFWNIFMKCAHFNFICHWLMLTFFCGKYSRISIVFLIINWCWVFFCPECSYHSQVMSMWFSCTETCEWSVCTSSSFVIYWCWHIFVL